MADKKTDSIQHRPRVAVPSAGNDSCHPDKGQPCFGKGLGTFLSNVLGRTYGSPAQQTQSSPQESSGSTAEFDSSETETPSTATPRQRSRKGRSRGRSARGTVGSSFRRHRLKKPIREGGETRQRVMMGLIPVLAITLVFVVRNPLKVSAVPSDENTQSVVSETTASRSSEINWQIPPLYLPDGRDPMQLPPPPVTPTVEGTDDSPAPVQTRVELTVTGILYSQDRPAAIVDTHLVHEGEQISGATVKKIEMDGVEFEINGQTWKQAVDKK